MASQNYRRPVPAPRSGPSAENSSPSNMADPTSIGSRSAQAMAAAAMSSMRNQLGPMNDARAKTVLKEAVDAVVNSFAKHTQGYGRGKKIYLIYFCVITDITYFIVLQSCINFTL